uniref:Uncharacterized protein n=1 Tax=Mycena chlorophos TaxID=658473 RepID=A0ABQ0LQW0_MYCCL|nr:predicted protein [Mycena chlorophos]
MRAQDSTTLATPHKTLGRNRRGGYPPSYTHCKLCQLTPAGDAALDFPLVALGDIRERFQTTRLRRAHAVTAALCIAASLPVVDRIHRPRHALLVVSVVVPSTPVSQHRRVEAGNPPIQGHLPIPQSHHIQLHPTATLPICLPLVEDDSFAASKVTCNVSWHPVLDPVLQRPCGSPCISPCIIGDTYRILGSMSRRAIRRPRRRLLARCCLRGSDGRRRRGSGGVCERVLRVPMQSVCTPVDGWDRDEPKDEPICKRILVCSTWLYAYESIGIVVSSSSSTATSFCRRPYSCAAAPSCVRGGRDFAGDASWDDHSRSSCEERIIFAYAGPECLRCLSAGDGCPVPARLGFQSTRLDRISVCAAHPMTPAAPRSVAFDIVHTRNASRAVRPTSFGRGLAAYLHPLSTRITLDSRRSIVHAYPVFPEACHEYSSVFLQARSSFSFDLSSRPFYHSTLPLYTLFLTNTAYLPVFLAYPVYLRCLFP